MKKRNLIPFGIAAAVGIFSLVFALGLPAIRFFGIDWRILLLAGLGFLTFKVFRWSQSLIGELPP
ncbi:hypothetical protein HYU12_05205 [Candidatus Woesearchaeota archaeon]|nr:hypothetical protein [Candidatus Woesearchaeota archaeon]